MSPLLWAIVLLLPSLTGSHRVISQKVNDPDLKDLYLRYEQLFEAGNISSLVHDLYAPDAVQHYFGYTSRGRKEILKFWPYQTGKGRFVQFYGLKVNQTSRTQKTVNGSLEYGLQHSGGLSMDFQIYHRFVMGKIVEEWLTL